jgi:putative transposase
MFSRILSSWKLERYGAAGLCQKKCTGSARGKARVGICDAAPRKPANPFRYFHSSPEVIRLVVMMYVRFPLSLRNIEDLLFEPGIDICHETVRLWNRFGPMFAADIRRQRVSRMRGFRHWKWHLDEVYVKIHGELHYLWRAVDQEGEVLESYVTNTRDKAAALRFIKKTLKRHGSPEAIRTDGLRSYGAAMKVLGDQHKQEIGRWANNRVESSHQPFRRRERAMLRFRQMKALQKFASVHGSIHNHFNQERHLISRETYRDAARPHWPSGSYSPPVDAVPCPTRVKRRRVAMRLTAPGRRIRARPAGQSQVVDCH